MKTITIKKLVSIAKNAGDIVMDCSSNLNYLGVIYGENIPLSEVKNVLAHYDIEYKEVNKPTKKSKEKWVSLDELANRGLI